MGRGDEALSESKRALELDPLDVEMTVHLSWHYYSSRQYEQAAEQARRAVEMDSNFSEGHLFLGESYEQQGKLSEAVQELEKALAQSGERTWILAALGHAYARSGQKEKAQETLGQLLHKSYVSKYDVAVIYAGLGETNRAFHWLHQAYLERSDQLVFLDTDPRMDNLRGEPRFRELLQRIGLPLNTTAESSSR